MTDQINVGLVAFGMSGEFFHAPFIHANPNLHLKSVVERHEEKSKRKYPYVNVVRSLDELIADDSISLVVITTPNHLHYEMAEKCMQAGKHVVIEKPFTVTSADADALIEMAKKNNVLLTVYQNRRWDGDFQTISELLANKMLGDVVEYEAHFDRYRTYIKPDSSKEEQQPGSGILYDLGPHLIDQALLLFGKPYSVRADLRKQRPVTEVTDNFEIQLEFDDKKAVLKAGMIVREKGPHFIIHGVDGSFVKYGMDPQEEALLNGESPLSEGWGVESRMQWGTINTDIDGLHFHGKIETKPGAYGIFYSELCNAIAEEGEVPVKPEDARNAIRIIEMAQQSSNEQRTLAITSDDLK
jgi:predicted dehydrogenase